MTEVAVCSGGDSAGFNIKMNKILTSTWVAAFNISWIILTIMWWAVKGLGEVSFCQGVITRFSCVPFSSFPLLNSRQSCQQFYCICWGYPTCLYTSAFCVIQYVLQMCLIFVECPLLFQPPPSFMYVKLSISTHSLSELLSKNNMKTSWNCFFKMSTLIAFD